jgi:hypothetical protein
MTTISKSENRVVTFDGIEEGHVLISEKIRYHRPGYTRGSWEVERLSITIDELEKITRAALRSASSKGTGT